MKINFTTIIRVEHYSTVLEEKENEITELRNEGINVLLIKAIYFMYFTVAIFPNYRRKIIQTTIAE